MSKLRQFIGDDRGATSIEYAIIAGTISIAILIAVQNIGSTLNTTFTSVRDAV